MRSQRENDLKAIEDEILDVEERVLYLSRYNESHGFEQLSDIEKDLLQLQEEALSFYLILLKKRWEVVQR